MSVYVTISKYCIVQKGYESLNLGFLIQAWKSDFQTSECIRITRDWLKKSWMPIPHLMEFSCVGLGWSLEIYTSWVKVSDFCN